MKNIIFLILFTLSFANAQVLNHKKEFTRQDSLRGTDNEFRNWWNVLRYDIQVEPDFDKKFIKGKYTIQFEVTGEKTGKIMQIDLQQPMKMDGILFDGKKFTKFQR